MMDQAADIALFSAKVLMLFITFLTVAACLVLAELTIQNHLPDRARPYRTAPWGLLQTMADLIKPLTREHLFPSAVQTAHSAELEVAVTLVTHQPDYWRLITPH